MARKQLDEKSNREESPPRKNGKNVGCLFCILHPSFFIDLPS